ncbi:MAG: hypothetical protein P8J87_02540 [Verrucomicrobiales bacterium]|nr:hypothetical protein [Verrucomicrobiales bacterium]
MEQEPIPPFPTPLHNQDGSLEDPRIIRAQLESTIRYAQAILRRLDTQDQPNQESTTPDSGSSADVLTPELVEELDRELSEAFEEAGEQRGEPDTDEEQAAAHTRAPLTFSAEPVTEDEFEKLDNGVAGIADSSVVLEFKDGGYTSKFKPKRTPGLALPS